MRQTSSHYLILEKLGEGVMGVDKYDLVSASASAFRGARAPSSWFGVEREILQATLLVEDAARKLVAVLGK